MTSCTFLLYLHLGCIYLKFPVVAVKEEGGVIQVMMIDQEVSSLTEDFQCGQ